MSPIATKGTVILGVAASDAHVVANHLIAYLLRERGYNVVNLGACTTIEEFADAAERHPGAKAMLIGSHNGHAFEDLKPLREARDSGRIQCPVVVGGNLSVGSAKSRDTFDRLRAVGVDHILSSHEDIVPLLNSFDRLGERAAFEPARMVS